MKILIITDNLKIGGSEKVLINLANIFSLNHKIDFVILKNDNEFKEIISKEINLIKLNLKRTLYSFFKVYKIFKNSRTDIILSNLTHINLLCLFVNFFLFNKKKIIIRETTNISEKFQINEKKIKNTFIKFIIKFFYNSSFKIIVMGEEMKKDLINNFSINKKKINIIYNPFNLKEIITSANENILDEHKFVLNPYIIAVGRLVYVKGFDFLINAFDSIKNKTKLNLVIIGDGPEKISLSKLIKQKNLEERVFLLGQRSNPYKYIQKAKIFTLTSRREGFPNSLIEALILNKPVLSVNVKNGPKEILTLLNLDGLVNEYDEIFFGKEILNTIRKGYDKKIDIKKLKFYFEDKKIANQYLNTFSL